MSAKRRPPQADDPTDPTIVAAPAGAVRQEDATGFSVRWSATVVYPSTADEIVEVACNIEGRFSTSEPIDDELYELFSGRESFILLWPYLRAAVGEIARMLAVSLPPLPTVDVRSFLAAGAEAGSVQEAPAAVPD